MHKFIQSNEIAMGKNLRKKQLGYLTRTISALLSYFSHFIVLVFAAYLVLKGDFTAGSFFIAVGMIDQLSYPIISLSYFIQDLVSVRPTNKSILEFINERPSRNGSREVSKKDFKEILFENVSFAYDGEGEILTNLNMEITKNKQYLLKGTSGSGKTTSINLLLKYFKPINGDIKINDISVSEIKNLNELITIMRQNTTLFEDTLRNNITMYKSMPDDKLIDILSKVGLDNYAKQDKLDMLINEGGTNFSGGEKRRITLARCLLRNTPILILDEPLANLDEDNAKEIEKLLLSINDRTVIIISHQFSKDKLIKFDKIIDFI